MTYATICEAVECIRKKYQEDDPFRLCKVMGIVLLFEPFGTDPDAIKGFYLESHRIKTITVNSDLPEVVQKIIVTHEIGHAVLHRNRGVCAFHDVTMFDENSEMERDANLFTAEFLMKDDDVLSCLNADNTFFSAAAQLYVPMELLDFKFRVMKWKGFMLIEPPISAKSNFLRDMEVPVNED